MLGQPHIHLETTDSTNVVAKEQATLGAAHGTTITADAQTSGRGRQGREWVAPTGCALLMSVILRPAEPRHRFAPLAAALAVAETCELLGGVQAEIKWPNDVWIDGRKVAGILVEARPDHDIECSWVVIGVGLNTAVNLADLPEELRQTAASLNLAPDADALTPLLARLEHWLSTPVDQLLDAWRERDALLGRTISWSEGSGIAEGIDEEGNLLVRSEGGGLHSLGAGEVHLKLG